MRDGRTSTSARSNASRAAAAAAIWPQWIGIERAAEDADAIQIVIGPRVPRVLRPIWSRVRGQLLPHRFEQQRQSLAGDRRHSVKRNPGGLQMRAQALEPGRIVQRVDLVRGDDDRLVLQPFARGVAPGEQRELARDHVEILDRIAPSRRRHVDDVHEDAGPLEMAQEPMAEAVALVRPLDQSRHVGDDERAIAREADDAEVRGRAW